MSTFTEDKQKRFTQLWNISLSQCVINANDRNRISLHRVAGSAVGIFTHCLHRPNQINPYFHSVGVYAKWQFWMINVIMLTEGLALDHLFQYHIPHLFPLANDVLIEAVNHPVCWAGPKTLGEVIDVWYAGGFAQVNQFLQITWLWLCPKSLKCHWPFTGIPN